MPNWHITSTDDPRFRVTLADCTHEHAQSVLETLLSDPTLPSELVLTKLDAHGEPRRGIRYRWRR